MDKSWFEARDPRLRLGWMFFLSAVAMYHSSLLALSVVIITLVPVWYLAKSFRLLVTTAVKVTPFLLFLVATQILSSFLYRGLIVDNELWIKVIGQIMKVFVMITASVLLFKTTRYDEIALAVRTLKVRQHGAWNMMIERVAFTFGTAYQFIPLLVSELQSMREVRRARGDDLNEGSGMQKAKKMILLGTPLLNRTFELIKNLLLSMINYGYQPDNPRTQLKSLQFVRTDFIALAVLLVSIVALGMLPK